MREPNFPGERELFNISPDCLPNGLLDFAFGLYARAAGKHPVSVRSRAVQKALTDTLIRHPLCNRIRVQICFNLRLLISENIFGVLRIGVVLLILTSFARVIS